MFIDRGIGKNLISKYIVLVKFFFIPQVVQQSIKFNNLETQKSENKPNFKLGRGFRNKVASASKSLASSRSQSLEVPKCIRPPPGPESVLSFSFKYHHHHHHHHQHDHHLLF